MPEVKECPYKKNKDVIRHQAQIALEHPYNFKKTIRKAAVIGAGPYGLNGARHLKEAGLNVKIYERSDSVGGIWRYSETPPPKPEIPTSSVTSNPLDLSHVPPEGEKYQRILDTAPDFLSKRSPASGCYRDLHTNIPSKHFAYPDFPFPEGTPTLVGHAHVLAYIKEFASRFELLPLISFETSVDQVRKIEGGWELILSKYEVNANGVWTETRWRESFDAVIAASGMHQEPFLPDFKHLVDYDKAFPTRVSHSKQFRRPEDYINKNVLIIGARVSGVDLARSIEGFAKSVTMSIKGPFVTSNPIENSVRALIPKDTIIKPTIASYSTPEGCVDGTITFEDGTTMDNIDQVVFCTGYRTSLRYLQDLIIEDYQPSSKVIYEDVPKSHVVLGSKHALNTYHETFLLSDPTLCFISMSSRFSITPFFDSQARTIARVWTGNAYLPESSYMHRLAAEFKPDYPEDEFACDRMRREVFVTWLNNHAEKSGKSLPHIENFGPNYEEEGKKLFKTWGELTEANFRRSRERLLKETVPASLF
ncbi:hypothetical protein BY458DRAFT_432547 [Sporodiniella umbellata]|nr:hypothetical protein BY458DRAFT_432547 [Sporodiniella umbellata]